MPQRLGPTLLGAPLAKLWQAMHFFEMASPLERSAAFSRSAMGATPAGRRLAGSRHDGRRGTGCGRSRAVGGLRCGGGRGGRSGGRRRRGPWSSPPRCGRRRGRRCSGRLGGGGDIGRARQRQRAVRRGCADKAMTLARSCDLGQAGEGHLGTRDIEAPRRGQEIVQRLIGPGLVLARLHGVGERCNPAPPPGLRADDAPEIGADLVRAALGEVVAWPGTSCAIC